MKNKRPPTSALFTRPNQAIMQCLCGRLGSERPGQQWGIMAVRKPSWPSGVFPSPLRPLSHSLSTPKSAHPAWNKLPSVSREKQNPPASPLALALRMWHASQTNSNTGHTAQWLRAQELGRHWLSKTHSLCELGQVAPSLRTLMLSSVKWEDGSAQLPELNETIHERRGY